MKIGIASDHRGLLLKEQLIPYLEGRGYEIENYGTDTEVSVDYPDYAFLVGGAVASHKIDFGILICGSGIGMSIACNKVKGVRCAKVDNIKEAKVTRLDNDANVIALSSELSVMQAKDMIDTFLETPFSEIDRHIRRIEKITRYES